MLAFGRHFIPALLLASGLVAAAAPIAEPAKEPPPRRDRFGDPLPEGAIYRLGSSRFRAGWYVYFLAFSKDGQTLLSINATSSATDGVVRRWEAASGKQRGQFPLPLKVGTPREVALSPDRTLLAVLPDTWGAKPIALLDAAAGRVVRRFAEQEHGGGIAFSPDGRTLATADRKGAILFWDPASGATLGKLEGCPSVCRTLAFSPDGKLLGSAHMDNTVRLWDRTARRELQCFQPVQRTWPVDGMAFSPDGKLLAAHRCRSIDLWSTTTGERVRTLPLNGGSPSAALAFSPDGKLLAAQDLYDLCLWETASGKEVQRKGRFWNRSCLAFSPDGKVLATGDDNVHLWQVATGSEIRPGGDESAEVAAAAFAPDGRLLAAGGPDEFIRLWDASSGAAVRRFKACPDGNPFVGFSPDSKSLFSRHGNFPFHGDEFFLWDAATGDERRCFQGPRPAFNVTLSPSGRRLVWLGADVAVHIQDVASGKEVRPWQRPNGVRIHAFQFSPREDLLMVNGVSGIRSEILNLATRQVYPAFEKEWDFAGFSPDSRFVARTDGGGRIHFQETTTGADRACTRLADVLPFAGGGPRKLYASAFSPDGKMLAAMMASEPIRLWETATGAERLRLPGHIGWVKQLAFSPDGGKLVSVGSEKMGLVWQMFDPLPGQRPVELSAEQLRSFWSDLADDEGRTAFRALRALTAASSGSVVDFLRREMRAVPRLDPRRIARWIAELDADEFAVREKAMTALDKLGALAQEPLREALRNRPSLEARKRMEGLLEKLKGRTVSPETVRLWRAVEVLEHLATLDARRLLEQFADGKPDARLTREAKASLERLAGLPQFD